jgi:uncharacterized membrane protein YgcG
MLLVGFAGPRLSAQNVSPEPDFAKAAQRPCPPQPACPHIIDLAGAVPRGDLPRFNHYMAHIARESDVDIRMVFVRGTGARSIESLAVQAMQTLRIGGRTAQERGLLVLFDVDQRRLKIEVGYGLEAYFPDAFVGYLVTEHARLFFETNDLSVGLRLMLRLLQNRIREAVLGGDFDPRVLQALHSRHFSGGAGVAATLPLRVASGAATPAPGNAQALQSAAATSPQGTYANYLQVIADPIWNPQVDLFTAASRSYLAGFPLSPAYQQFILLGEYGKRHRIVERGDLALLVFTGTPFVSPHFLVRQQGVWRIDMIAEVRNTVEHVGGEYTWAYRGQDDAYTQAFGDLLVNLKGYRRFRDGDNRALPIRGGAVNLGALAPK